MGITNLLDNFGSLFYAFWEIKLYSDDDRVTGEW